MRAGTLSVFAFVASLALTQAVDAQQHQPPPPPPMPLPLHGPASLSVPHPIAPIPTTPGTPRDLYQQQTPPPVVGPVVYPPGSVYGPYSPYGPFGPGYGYGSSTYVGAGYPTGVESLASAATVTRFAQGALRFESSPGTAQVFVDGVYKGVLDDFGMAGHSLELPVGAHRVEVQAPGYATLGFDIDITANQTTRYRGDLQRLSPSVSTRSAAPKTTYMIPNCYAGDRPPVRPLRRGCDVSKMIVHKP
jgi:hypothetical protein